MIYRDTADLVSIYHSQLSCPALLSCSVHSPSLPEHGQALSYLLAHVVAIPSARNPLLHLIMPSSAKCYFLRYTFPDTLSNTFSLIYSVLSQYHIKLKFVEDKTTGREEMQEDDFKVHVSNPIFWIGVNLLLGKTLWSPRDFLPVCPILEENESSSTQCVLSKYILYFWHNNKSLLLKLLPICNEVMTSSPSVWSWTQQHTPIAMHWLPDSQKNYWP